jgi:hypothetical protein
MKIGYLDCCSEPDMEDRKTILATNCESEGILPELSGR